jgi:hypothetical protein
LTNSVLNNGDDNIAADIITVTHHDSSSGAKAEGMTVTKSVQVK